MELQHPKNQKSALIAPEYVRKYVSEGEMEKSCFNRGGCGIVCIEYLLIVVRYDLPSAVTKNPSCNRLNTSIMVKGQLAPIMGQL